MAVVLAIVPDPWVDGSRRDRAAWAFAPLVLAHVTYALWHRPLAGGFVAHADFGDRVLAAWGNGDLPSELLRMQLVDVSSHQFE